jgi:hypothetical protein
MPTPSHQDVPAVQECIDYSNRFLNPSSVAPMKEIIIIVVVNVVVIAIIFIFIRIFMTSCQK